MMYLAADIGGTYSRFALSGWIRVPGRHSEAIGKSDRRQTLGADGCEKGLLRHAKTVHTSYTPIRFGTCRASVVLIAPQRPFYASWLFLDLLSGLFDGLASGLHVFSRVFFYALPGVTAAGHRTNEHNRHQKPPIESNFHRYVPR